MESDSKGYRIVMFVSIMSIAMYLYLSHLDERIAKLEKEPLTVSCSCSEYVEDKEKK